MKFLFEGRKEEILKKYMDEFDIQVLDTILNDPFIKSTNYKYADWILKNLEFNSTPLAIEVIELVKQFDRIGKNLEMKDLNQYPDVVELRSALENYTSKSQEKKIGGEAEKIYEDDRVLIVRPITHAASCKYGMGTKWCTTQSSPGYFEKYATGNNVLYYIMMKEFDISNKFYKIALHKAPNADTWYDSQDTVLPPREVEILKVGLGKRANKNLENDFSKHKNKALGGLFNENNNSHVVVTNDLFGSGKLLVLQFSNPRIIEDIDEDLAEMDLSIFLTTGENEEEIENGFLFIQYKLNGDYLNTMIGYQENDEFEVPLEINSLYRASFGTKDFLLNRDNLFNRFCSLISAQIWKVLKNDTNLQKYVLGNKKLWYPNRSSYGFTFERKDGLISKLVDYLDSGKEGNAIDFLIDVGKIKVEIGPDGEKKYVGKQGYITPKGYFSAFFGSAVRAGILSYTRKNKKNILSKGPNFDDFKEGNLVPL